MSLMNHQYKNSKSCKIIFTVFTPTYNRATTLIRVYESLKKQTIKNFEWLIIDDGSTDNTKAVVDEYIAENLFQIRYLWQPNQHKKAAINYGAKEAKGYFFLIWDSDDSAIDSALETFLNCWQSIPNNERENFAGICGLCNDEDNKLVGSHFPKNNLVSNMDEIYYRYKVTGEKWLVLRTDVIRSFPFPDFIKGHVPESIVWSAIGKEYKILFINEVVRIYYVNSNESLTNTPRTLSIIQNNAEGCALWAKSTLDYQNKWFFYKPLWFLRMAINMSRFNLHKSNPLDLPKSFFGQVLYFLLFPFGYFIYKYDLRLR